MENDDNSDAGRWVLSTARICHAMIDEFKDATVILVSVFAPSRFHVLSTINLFRIVNFYRATHSAPAVLM